VIRVLKQGGRKEACLGCDVDVGALWDQISPVSVLQDTIVFRGGQEYIDLFE
jgi:hypothetical protein